MTNIASIVEIGEEETCDLEVDHPDHQFYLSNGVLTSNSHACAYSIDSFWCAWLLTYYEEQWIAAYLESMSSTPDNRAKAFGEVKSLGYQIVPIDINHAKLGWSVFPGKKLMPSMTTCKGVGDSAVEEIMELRPFDSIEKLLYNEDGSWRLSKFNKKALESLIKIRAFESLDCIGDDKLFKSYRHMHETFLGSYVEVVKRKRKGVEEEVEMTREHMSLIKKTSAKDPHEGRKNLYDIARRLVETHGEEWSKKETAELHAEIFGSVDIMTMFDQAIFDKLVKKGISSIEELDVGKSDLCWFVSTFGTGKKGSQPTSGSMKKTKNGKEYAQIFVSGQTGKQIRVNVWGAKQLCEPYKLFVAECKKDDYGVSTVSFKMKEIA